MNEFVSESTNAFNHQVADGSDLNTSVINDWVFYLLKKWWLFLIVGFITGIAGILYAYYQKPAYESRISFALDDAGGSGGLAGAMNLAAQFGLNFGGGGKDIFTGDNIIEIINSRRMIERVLLSVDTFDNKPYSLIDYYLNVLNKPIPKLSSVLFPPQLERSGLTYLQDSVLYITYLAISNNKIVAQKPDRKLSIYEVKFTSTNEKFTKIFTDRLVEATNKFYAEIRTKKTKETLEILEKRVATMQDNLNASIGGRAATQDANLNTAFSAAQIPVLKQQANMQVYGAAYAEMFKNLELARFQYLNEMPLMQIIDQADYPMKKIKPGKLATGILFSIFSTLFTLLFLWLNRVLRRRTN